MTDWKKIRKEWENSKISLKDLAKQHKVNYSTLVSRKYREKWYRPGDEIKNKGNKGNKMAKPPKGNKNAAKHGLFAKWLPDDVLEIALELDKQDPKDMLWQNIIIQYTAIIRSQKIMYVANQEVHDSLNVELQIDPTIKDKKGQPATVKEKREWHLAYQKQESFLNAQSRAISTLSNLIKQYVAMSDDEDERKLKLQQMQANITKLEVETTKLKAETEQSEELDTKIDSYLESIKDLITDD